MADTKDDHELAAIQQVVAALSGLDPEARTRVISYVFQRLGVSSSAVSIGALTSGVAPIGSAQGVAPVTPAGRKQIDIRSFGEEKGPRNSNERVAVVAYYLTELAPADERKNEISAADITKYFKQAGFPLPGAARMALVNSKNAGYLDAGAERGTYRLNPVGHNLVAHGLPASSTGNQRAKKSRTRKRAKKSEKSGRR